MNNTSRKTTSMEMERAFVAPPANIRENMDEVIVELEMPGVDRNRLDVSVDGDELIVTGHRLHEKTDSTPVWRETRDEDFRRSFTLGDHVNRAAISASFQDGVLTLRLSKAEDVKPRHVEVQFA
ncbi:MAG: Hsp20/alpha crystallin family protein [Verrucomicrobiae bacterium]|nr:Hsp20/alpha crystallin family protein [Verrucomicrobiae bacterium]